MDSREGEKRSPSFHHQLSRDKNIAEAGPEVEQTDTGSRAGADHKRKRISNADGTEKPQDVGPSGGGDIEATVDIESKEDVASSSGTAAAWGAQRMEQEPCAAESTRTARMSLALAGPTDEPCINPLTIELQMIKQQIALLEMNNGTMHSVLKKEMEEELEKVRKMFEEKLWEEEIKFQQEQAYLEYASQKLLWNQALAEWAATNKSWAEQWIASASGSSQAPRPTTQLRPPTCAPQQICRAPAPTGSAPAMHTAQAGGHSGSVLWPHLPSTSSNGLSTAPSTAPSWSRPSTGTSSQGFGPCAGTPLRHPGHAITAAALAPAPHFTSFQPCPSIIPANLTPGATTSFSTPLIPHPATATRDVLRAPAPHLRPHLSVTPGTSSTNPAPRDVLRPPYVGSPLSRPAPAPGVLFQGSRNQVALPGPYPSTIPRIFAPTYGPSGGTVTNNGNVNYTTADYSIRRNRNGASSSRADGNASGTGRWAVNEDGVICLYDDNWNMIN